MEEALTVSLCAYDLSLGDLIFLLVWSRIIKLWEKRTSPYSLLGCHTPLLGICKYPHPTPIHSFSTPPPAPTPPTPACQPPITAWLSTMQCHCQEMHLSEAQGCYLEAKVKGGGYRNLTMCMGTVTVWHTAIQAWLWKWVKWIAVWAIWTLTGQ